MEVTGYGDLSALLFENAQRYAVLAGHTEDKEKETLRKALSDVMDAARKAMAGKSFARSPYRAPIAALAAGATAALAYLEQGEREKMREEILTALNAAAK